ncbi:hypothetical protein A5780_19280 [Nocardia sp. 852002-20019_SCH5090214]|uniref:hypothetical protein n=1 Tax=Nocardia sp. 852002-20019_SCH5090214 TaxID=1834087 RepID=UPI0007EA533B|nr:hypothetical protein [Nocardia sp. 852002-20019_SCH5090214]OBA62202.1 hypothetical protein A5780_19280 [Nocardia sp. 852002-20019_SCH5090214]
MRRSALDDARDTARLYRNALKAIAPQRCAEIDEIARQRGQHWAAPIELPAEAAAALMDARLSPVDVERSIGIPAGTIRAWVNKGLIENHGEKGRPKVLVSDVLEAESRHRKPPERQPDLTFPV